MRDLADHLSFDLETALTAVDSEMQLALSTDEPVTSRCVERLLADPGKRLRPAMVLAVALGDTRDEPTSGRHRSAHRAAAAIELIHLSSLVHDDLIDDASTRRGAETINVTEGPESALLFGDYLIARAIELISAVGGAETHLLGQVLAELTLGQMRELQVVGDATRTESDWTDCALLKTASLFEASCHIGATVGDRPQHAVDAVVAFAGHFGVGFQLVDDILDLISEPALIGKATGADLAGGVYTIPFIRAIAGEGRSAIEAALAKDDLVETRSLILGSGSLRSVAVDAMKRSAKAVSAAERIDGAEDLQSLARLAASTIEGSLETKIPAANQYYVR